MRTLRYLRCPVCGERAALKGRSIIGAHSNKQRESCLGPPELRPNAGDPNTRSQFVEENRLEEFLQGNLDQTLEATPVESFARPETRACGRCGAQIRAVRGRAFTAHMVGRRWCEGGLPPSVEEIEAMRPVRSIRAVSGGLPGTRR